MAIRSRNDQTGLDGLDAARSSARDAVHAARDAGDSWTIIGAALDATRQAAQQRFGND